MEKQNFQKIFFVLLILLISLIFINSLNNEIKSTTSEAIRKVDATDRNPPTLSITSPTDNYITNNPSLQLKGTAYDNKNVREIRVKFNNNNWEIIKSSSLNKILKLTNGENVVYVQAIDINNNISPVSKLRVVYK